MFAPVVASFLANPDTCFERIWMELGWSVNLKYLLPGRNI